MLRKLRAHLALLDDLSSHSSDAVEDRLEHVLVLEQRQVGVLAPDERTDRAEAASGRSRARRADS